MTMTGRQRDGWPSFFGLDPYRVGALPLNDLSFPPSRGPRQTMLFLYTIGFNPHMLTRLQVDAYDALVMEVCYGLHHYSERSQGAP